MFSYRKVSQKYQPTVQGLYEAAEVRVPPGHSTHVVDF
jgi:hypothetical protein